MWTAIINGVLRRPVVSAVAATAFLVALAIPAFGMKTTQMGASDLPQDIPVMQTYKRINKAFPFENNQATVVIKSDSSLHNSKADEAIADLEAEALATGQMHNDIETEYSKDGNVARVYIPMDGKDTDAAATAALNTLRDDVVPSTVGTLAGAEVNVSGTTAATIDSRDQLSHAMPIVFGFVLTFAFLLLLVADMSLPGLARIVADFTAALDLDEVTIVANDTGGAVAQWLVGHHPEPDRRAGAHLVRRVREVPPAPQRYLEVAATCARSCGWSPGRRAVQARAAAGRGLRLDHAQADRTGDHAVVHDASAQERGGAPRPAAPVARRRHALHVRGGGVLRGFDKPALVLWADGDKLPARARKATG